MKMRSHWVRVGPKFTTAGVIRRGKLGHRYRHRGKGPVWLEAGTEVVHLQTKQHQVVGNHPKLGEGHEPDSPQSHWKEPALPTT